MGENPNSSLETRIEPDHGVFRPGLIGGGENRIWSDALSPGRQGNGFMGSLNNRASAVGGIENDPRATGEFVKPRISISASRR